MVRSLAAITSLAALGILLVALPAPKVEASETFTLVKGGDRLQVLSPAIDCSQQTWPEIAISCLRSSDPAAAIQVARLVTARR